MTNIKNVTEFLKALECRDESHLAKTIFKGTDCGAWIKLTDAGVAVGSIVEGVDRCTEVQRLAFPFMLSAFWNALQMVEDEAKTIWEETHGCPTCGEETETGYVPINPECPVCKNTKVIL